MEAMYQEWATKVQTHVKENFDYVGDTFPEEARKIHYGETEERQIYGNAKPKEVKELTEEGIGVLPVPDPKAKPPKPKKKAN